MLQRTRYVPALDDVPLLALLTRQPARSRSSRLPGPAVNAGLTEWSDSQHNSRMQSSIPAPGPKGVKREMSHTGSTASGDAAHRVDAIAAQPDPKRKLLAERAAEYPPKLTADARTIKGQNLPAIQVHDPRCSLFSTDASLSPPVLGHQAPASQEASAVPPIDRLRRYARRTADPKARCRVRGPPMATATRTAKSLQAAVRPPTTKPPKSARRPGKALCPPGSAA